VPADIPAMNREEVIADVRRRQPALEAEGVTHVYLFGSVLHGDAGPASDVDLLFEHKLEDFGLVEYARLKRIAGELLPYPVDFIERSCLDPRVGERVLPEALKIF
jgi:predicted nucleotidyltransferase